jgi:hypothetical protein
MAAKRKASKKIVPTLESFGKGRGWYVKWTRVDSAHTISLHRTGKPTKTRKASARTAAGEAFAALMAEGQKL